MHHAVCGPFPHMVLFQCLEQILIIMQGTRQSEDRVTPAVSKRERAANLIPIAGESDAKGGISCETLSSSAARSRPPLSFSDTGLVAGFNRSTD